MWRIGVLFLAALLELNSADIKTGVNPVLVHRLKRSPQYYNNCGPPGPPPPPPPPPPYWPPPPLPPFWTHHHHPPSWGPPQYQPYSEANAESNANAGGNKNGDSANREGGSIPPKQAPCTSCGDGSNAVSNAKSDSGQAVAVAIARASTH